MSHISIHPPEFSGNQGNHQSFEKSLLYYKCWIIFIKMKQEKNPKISQLTTVGQWLRGRPTDLSSLPVPQKVIQFNRNDNSNKPEPVTRYIFGSFEFFSKYATFELSLMSNNENKFQPIFQILHIKSAWFLLELAMALVTTIGTRFLQVWVRTILVTNPYIFTVCSSSHVKVHGSNQQLESNYATQKQTKLCSAVTYVSM